MLAKTRRVLDVIDKALAEGDQAAYDLWYLLTATRGPDDAERGYRIKRVTTAPLRAKMFPKLYSATEALGPYGMRAWWGGKKFPAMADGEPQPVEALPGGEEKLDDHFTTHYALAIEALNRHKE